MRESVSTKELKAAIISSIGKKELQGKKFVEKGEFVKQLEELRYISDAKRQGVDLVPADTYLASPIDRRYSSEWRRDYGIHWDSPIQTVRDLL